MNSQNVDREMDLVIKSGESVLFDEVTPKESTITAQDLHNQQLRLQDELREMMNDGNAAGVIRVQNILRDLPDRMIATKVAEIKKGIDKATARLAEIKTEEAEVRTIRGELSKVLDERIDAMEEARAAVNRTDFELFLLRNEEHITVGSRRDFKLRLEKLLEDTGGNKYEH